MRPMTNEVRAKILKYKRNGLDISPLIEDVSIKGEDLSGCIIERFSPKEKDLKGTNFSHCIIGKVGVITNICSKDFRNCNFTNVKLVGVVWGRRCDFRGSNFQSAELPHFEYQHSDMRDCNFCEVLIRFGVSYGLGAKIDTNIFQDLGENWGMKITVGE